MPKPKQPKTDAVYITVCKPDGEVLDSFLVTDWRADETVAAQIAERCGVEDVENIGSVFANAGLVERIARCLTSSERLIWSARCLLQWAGQRDPR